ncbi:AAA family ATPase [Arthrobacter caoxuetaonis]|uniref:AAA family ATPase n=1 Tax=Arthrobacter caoxuetaonis TaxID=2886935 RepID=UPI001D14BDE4|nr:ATP-binding protein [Arthrobacter caoxuetaonis]MCC3281850.1 ATP-binding protein [Arthrobacter caoxuetaonis]MCC3283111.1 ATP-binding protein [Arthrobacter caoxuetaonis]
MEKNLADFLASFNAAVELAQQHRAASSTRPRLRDALSAYLGLPAQDVPIVVEAIPFHRFADVDIAMEQIAAEDPGNTLIGLGGGQQRQHLGLSDIVQEEGYGYIPVGQPDFVNIAVGPDSSREAVGLGIRLFRHDGVPVAVLQRNGDPQTGSPDVQLAVMAAERPAAAAVLAAVQEHLRVHSILRGQVISLGFDPYGPGGAGVNFLTRPSLPREKVILPDGVLERVRSHVLGIAGHRGRLQAAGQHLKRGVLLYGPPGTGKTHTVRHLLSESPGTTAVLLTGASLGAISQAASLARAMAPSLVVLEDIDLVAEDRNMGHGPQPLLFQVLDALDGLDADADIAFVMTTNRVDVLEPALAQRPGRVDLAVEIPLPDAGDRVRLMELYAPAGVFSAAALAAVAEQSDGATASFARELVRRAILAAAEAGEDPGDVHLLAAAEDLSGQREAMTRSLLGGADPTAGFTANGDAGDGRGAPAPGIAWL